VPSSQVQIRDAYPKKSEKFILQELATKKNGLISRDEAEVIVEAVLKSEDVPIVKSHLLAE
jgi:hypothetical protein